VRTLRVAERAADRRNDAASRGLKLAANPTAATLARRAAWLGK